MATTVTAEQCKEWLIDETTVEEAEFKSKEELKNFKMFPPVPFGPFNPRWNRFKANMQDGDKLYNFRSPEKTWEEGNGRFGLAIVRGVKKEVIEFFVCLKMEKTSKEKKQELVEKFKARMQL